jgi:hypothetical protein
MTIMTSHSSATAREETPHETERIRTPKYSNAVRRRALAHIRDGLLDGESLALIRYGLEINDPQLPELVRRADAGERNLSTLDLSAMPAASYEDDPTEEKIETLAEIICRGGDDCVAALLVLTGAIENSEEPKVLANAAKHLAFLRCSELNLYRLVDVQIGEVEMALLGGNELTG